MTTQPEKLRNDQRFLIVLGLAVLSLMLMAPKPPPPPEPPPPATCDGLTNASDLDQDGIPDLVDCEGLSTGATSPANGGLIDYPGCIGAPDGTAPNCTDHTVADVFAEVLKASPSGYDDVAEIGTAIPDDEVFSFAESTLALNVHVLASGTLDTQSRLVWDGSVLGVTDAGGVVVSQAGVILVENPTVGAVCPAFPETTGISSLGNPNEFGVFQVFPRRVFQKIDCLGLTDSALKRSHLLNTSSHEFGHGGIRQAPDPNSHHQQTVGDCVMEASIEPDRRGRLDVPVGFCSNSQDTILAGTTNVGPVLCGDAQPAVIDQDPTFGCLPKTP